MRGIRGPSLLLGVWCAASCILDIADAVPDPIPPGTGGAGGDATGGGGPCSMEDAWSVLYGDAALQIGQAAAVDADDAVVFSAVFAGNFDLRTETLSSMGDPDLLLAKVRADGSHAWSRSYDVQGTATLQIAVDSAGIVGAGHYRGTIQLGSDTLQSYETDLEDVYVARWSSAGTLDWFKNYAFTGAALLRDVALAPDGRIAMVGSYGIGDTLDFGCGMPLPYQSSGEGYIVELEPDGSCRNQRPIRGEAKQWGAAAAFTPNSDLVVVGVTDDDLSLTGFPCTHPMLNNLDADAVVLKIDQQGTILWCAALGPGALSPSAVVVDSESNIVVAGSYEGEIDFLTGDVTAVDADDAFVLALDSNKNPIWIKSYGGPGMQRVVDIAIDAMGGVVVTGEFEGSLNGIGVALESRGARDLFLLKLDPDGAVLEATSFGGVADDAVVGLALGTTGCSVQLSGGTMGAIDFGTGAHESQGDWDGFIAKIRW